MVVPFFQMWNLVGNGRGPKPPVILSNKRPCSRLNFGTLYLWEVRPVEFSRVVTLKFSRFMRHRYTELHAGICKSKKPMKGMAWELLAELTIAELNGTIFLKMETGRPREIQVRVTHHRECTAPCQHQEPSSSQLSPELLLLLLQWSRLIWNH